MMETGVHAKFTQNQDLKDQLIDTSTRQLQECNKFDSFWGIGLSLMEASNRDHYSVMKGTNVMGRILESVRDRIQ